MRLPLVLAAVLASFLSSGSALAKAAPDAELHTFYGEVKAVDLAAKTFTIKTGGKTFLFHYTDQTKISNFNRYIRWDTVRAGQGAVVVMRLGEGNVGVAVMVRFQDFADFSDSFALYSARTVWGENISGIATYNFVTYQPPAEVFNRNIDFGRHSGLFLLSVQPDGTVGNVRPLKSFGVGELDERAKRFLMKWKFRPNVVTEVRVPMTSNSFRQY